MKELKTLLEMKISELSASDRVKFEEWRKFDEREIEDNEILYQTLHECQILELAICRMKYLQHEADTVEALQATMNFIKRNLL